MQNFISIPTIESGLYMFGGHKHTVNGSWSFFEQRHQVFELMVITAGHQITEIRDQAPFDIGPGDAIIIAPGVYHTNRNASSTKKMTYMCLHFDFEDTQIRSQIIGLVSNKPYAADTQLAKLSYQMLNKIIGLSRDRDQQNEFDTQVGIEIVLLTYLRDLNTLMSKIDHKHNMPYSNKETKIGREIVMAIENRVNNDDRDPSFSFGDICKELAISSGYGHRVFKKVYGITPLHFIDREKYKKAQRLLEYSGNSIEEIAYMTGAANISIFSKQFKKWSGYTPSEYRKQGTHKRSVRSKNRVGYFE
ncbi:AraC family transcriptional regulator [Limosilactobacillus viscerum]|uniref:AraC family transcriptional regulator n=1 Tax=Limosilactobacillus viscerum TaxID=2993450 RepID=UPI0024BB5F43|nr:AraC family transcriptional regulator [Limosilactobacillus viscerum]